MFLIISLASFSSYFPYTYFVTLIYPYGVEACRFLLVPKTGPFACFKYMRVAGAIPMVPSVILIVVFIFIDIGGPLCYGFFLGCV